MSENKEIEVGFEDIEIEEECGIITELTREQLTTWLQDSSDIYYKSLGIVIEEDETVNELEEIVYKFRVIKVEKESRERTALVTADTFDEAVEAAVKILLEHGKNNENDGTKKKKKSSKKKASSTKEDKKPESPKEEPIKFEGPRIVRVFGRDVYIEQDSNATNNQIRTNLVNNYGFENFRSERVGFDFDSSTGILEVYLKFNAKG